VTAVLALAWWGQVASAEETTLPLGNGLPVVVRTGVHFLDIATINDAASSFDATVDLRFTWDDARLKFPAAEEPRGFREYRREEADARLAEIWHPDVSVANLVGDASFETRGLRVYPTGRVELMQRTKGQFATPFDVERFPFDRQRLAVEVVSRREPATDLVFDYRQSDLEFSRVYKTLQVAGWSVGAVELRRLNEEGWHGEHMARLFASLQVARVPSTTIGPIFIPLLASLLIPLLALWLNEVEDDGGFKVDAFELTNVLIGGLFALIALNFTVNSAFPMLAAGNPISMLFALNYVLLGFNLALNILLMRFGLAKRWFGGHVQREVYAYTVWATPALVAVAVGAILLRAVT